MGVSLVVVGWLVGGVDLSPLMTKQERFDTLSVSYNLYAEETSLLYSSVERDRQTELGSDGNQGWGARWLVQLSIDDNIMVCWVAVDRHKTNLNSYVK